MAVGWNYRQGHGPKDCRKEPFRKYLRDCGRYLESFDSGIWQVNSTWTSLTIELCGKSPRDGALFDVECNMKVTAYLYRHGGLAHWAASSSAAKNGD